GSWWSTRSWCRNTASTSWTPCSRSRCSSASCAKPSNPCWPTYGPRSCLMRRAETYGGSIPRLQPGDLSGWLVVVEGTDGGGRTPRSARLRVPLERSGYAVAETGLTRSDLASRGIRRAKMGNTLASTAYNLYYATDFADRLEHQIVPALRSGFVMLTDRYIY